MGPAASHRKVSVAVGRESDPLSGALSSQRRQPEVVIDGAVSLRDALRRAYDTGSDWIWVLDGSVAPRPDALAALLEALDRADGLPDPVVLAGVVLDAGGRVDESRAAWYRRNHIDSAMTAAERRLLPIRATAGPALVHRRGLEPALAVAPKRFAPASVLELTARVLRDDVGYLVPESEGDALTAVRDPLREPLTAARLLTSDAFVRFDRVRLGYELAMRASARLSALRRESPPAARSPSSSRSAG